MRKTLILGLSALAIAWDPGVSAEDGAVFVRGSLAYGTYSYDDSSGGNDSGSGFGYGVGTSLSVGRFLADLGLDYSKFATDGGVGGITPFGRTDLTLTGGYRVLDWLSPFFGLRMGFQGDEKTSLFSDDVWTESGYFIGSGFGPAELSPSLRLSGSLAYNKNEVEFDGGGPTLDYNGLSAKARLGFAGTPHAAELRYQKFTTDDDVADFEETYLMLAYIYTWKATTF